jgi:hypothetical protein
MKISEIKSLTIVYFGVNFASPHLCFFSLNGGKMNESFLSLEMIDDAYTVLEMESIFVQNFEKLEVTV